MQAETRITIVAETVVTLSELELKVWSHLAGYDPTHIREKVTGVISDADLRSVASSLRGKLEAAQARIKRARAALSTAEAAP